MECKIVHKNQAFVKQLENNINKDLETQFDPHTMRNIKIALQWGKISVHDTSNTYVCNPTHGINNVTNKVRMFRILKLNGIDIPPVKNSGSLIQGKNKYTIEQVKTVRNYYVFVFQFKTIIMYRSNDDLVWLSGDTSKMNQKYYEVKEEDTFETKRIARLAEKAIYSLGLDFGSVWIGVTSSKKRIILNVDTTPSLNAKRARLYRTAIVEFIKQYAMDMNSTNPVIGADPEFMFKSSSGKMILASKYFTRDGSIGCDARTINRNKARRPLGEIRPDPSGNPDQVLKNIRNIINEGVHVVNSKNVLWVAGSMPFKGYPIGGHVHFSNVKLNTPIVRAIDNYLGIPIALIENPESAKQRRPKYGFLGDVRNQFHGGFEYRTLGSWVLCPQISRAILYLSQFIVTNYTKLQLDFLNSYQSQRYFYTVNRNVLKEYFYQLWNEFEKIPAFTSIQKHVTIIQEMIVNDEIWDEQIDFKINWNTKSFQKVIREARSS